MEEKVLASAVMTKLAISTHHKCPLFMLHEKLPEMTSVDNLAKEWADLVLTKPAVAHEIESKWKRYQVSRTEKYKYESSRYVG